MKARKTVIAQLEKCYALGTFRYDGVDHVVASAERKNPCYTFDLEGKLCDTVWDAPGGVMTVTQVPGQPILMATQKFFSPDDSAEAKIVYYRRVDGTWKCELLCELPFVHRFGVLERVLVLVVHKVPFRACLQQLGHGVKFSLFHCRIY